MMSRRLFVDAPIMFTYHSCEEVCFGPNSILALTVSRIKTTFGPPFCQYYIILYIPGPTSRGDNPFLLSVPSIDVCTFAVLLSCFFFKFLTTFFCLFYLLFCLTSVLHHAHSTWYCCKILALESSHPGPAEYEHALPDGIEHSFFRYFLNALHDLSL